MLYKKKSNLILSRRRLAVAGLASSSIFLKPPLSSAAEVDSDIKNLTITVGQQGDDTQFGLVASHLFDNAPYEIKYATFESPTATLTALASGEIDIANGLSQWTLTQGAAAAVPAWTSETAPYKAVLVTGPDESVNLDRFVIAASRASGFTNIEQAKGARWGIVPGSALNLFAYWVLNKLGWTPQDVQIVNLDSTNQTLALETGRVDVSFTVTDNLSAVLKTGVKVLGSARDYGLVLYTGFQANTRAINDRLKGRAIADFVRRLVLYQNWLVLHPAEQQQALVRGLNLTTTQAADFYHYTRLIPIPPGNIAQYSQQLADFAFKAGLLRQKVDAGALLDNRYAQLIDETLKQANFFANLKSSYQTPS